MHPSSSIPHQKASPKRQTLHRCRSEIAKKVVAFDVLTHLDRNKKTAREAASILEVPNSTMQSWQAPKSFSCHTEQLKEFCSTPAGAEFLQRCLMAIYQVTHYGPSGLRGMQEFLTLSKLDCVVSSSMGALQQYSARHEEQTIAFGESEERRLAKSMKARKISVALDEMFRGKQPCLVAIEVVSNFILVEKFTEDRRAETWKNALDERLERSKVTIEQVVSDQGTGIIACTKQLGATHSPDLFHAQHELCKTVSAPLAKQKKSFEKELKEAAKRAEKAIEQRGKESKKAKEAVGVCNLLQHGLETKIGRQKAAREAVKAIGKKYHPVDLTTGKIQTAEAIEKGIDEQLGALKTVAVEAHLSERCLERLEKAKGVFEEMKSYMRGVLFLLIAYIQALQLDEKQELFFKEAIYPLAYLQMIWKRLPRKEREKHKPLKESLEAKIREGPWPEELKNKWSSMAQECAEKFQRSSSCVEGRNGMLSLLHHRQHRLSVRKLKALTVMHNYHVRRKDGTTPAERFFGAKHANLFETLVEKVRIPGKPQAQHHSEESRARSWEKRKQNSSKTDDPQKELTDRHVTSQDKENESVLPQLKPGQNRCAA